MTWYDPTGAEWTYVSRRLITVRIIVLTILWAPLVALSAVGAVLARDEAPVLWVVPVALVALAALFVFIIVRQVTAHAWAERDDDLVVKRGRLWRRVTVVPYGRMQYVEVQSGPVARAFGIARVQLHTASPGTDAAISGVPAAEAARLRDRLTERGQARLAGL